MENLFEEISRIKEIMLYEEFGASPQLIERYVDKVLERIDAYKLFDRFFNGEASLRKFREELIKKIKSGDYGNDFSEISKNLQYLKKSGMILAALEEVFEKDQQGNIEKELGLSYNDLAESTILGDWCLDCKSKDDVKTKIGGTIETKNRLKNATQEEFEDFIKGRYGDPFGLLSFFKTHGTRIEDISKKWGISRPEGQDEEGIRMGDFKVLIEFLEDTQIKVPRHGVILEKRKGEKLPTEYSKEEEALIHRTKDGTLIYMELDKFPRENTTIDSKVEKVVPRKGGYLEIKGVTPKEIKFKIVKL